MRSLFESKRLVLLLAVLALGSLTILAVSLNGMPFREAQHFAKPERQGTPPPVELLPVPVEVPDWRQLLVLVLLILLVVLIGAILSPRFRKHLFLLLLRVALWGLGIYFIMTSPQFDEFLNALRKNLLPLGSLRQEGAAPDNSLPPMPVFEPPQVSSTTSYVISFAFAATLLVMAWLLYRGWKRYMEMFSPSKPLEDIARIARSSLDDLSSGQDSGDVIVNCYLRMSDVVSSRRKLQRELAMTPREFALRLEEAGLPGEAVTRLTRLFEGVRYGDRKSAPRDIKEAVHCLETILQYCGESV